MPGRERLSSYPLLFKESRTKSIWKSKPFCINPNNAKEPVEAPSLNSARKRYRLALECPNTPLSHSGTTCLYPKKQSHLPWRFYLFWLISPKNSKDANLSTHYSRFQRKSISAEGCVTANFHVGSLSKPVFRYTQFMTKPHTQPRSHALYPHMVRRESRW